MTLKELNTYELPLWLQRYWERIQNRAFHEMKEENEQYQELCEKCEKMENENDFITKIVEGDAMTEAFPLNESEVKTLSSFLRLKADYDELEAMKIYLIGCRDMYYMLRCMRILE